MAQTFAQQVTAWATASKKRMLAVRNESVQRLVTVIQEPGPSVASTKTAVAIGAGLGKGGRASKKAFGPVRSGGAGRLPVDTGYLRASLVAAVGRVQIPTADKPAGDAVYVWDGDQVGAVLAGSKLSDSITIGYTAKYAHVMENRYAFVRLGLQQWPRIVATVAAEGMLRSAERGGGR